MKVIKKGVDNSSWGKKFICKGSGVGKMYGGCGAVLLVKPADIEEHYVDDGPNAYSFVCPDCGVRTSLKATDIKFDGSVDDGGES